MRQWVLSVPHPLRFLFASQPKVMGKVLGIVYRTLATHLIHKAGYKNCDAHTGAVTLVQRFGGALNLNIHFHMLFLDGVYVDRGGKLDRFRWVKTPTTAELSELTHTIAHRIGRYLERQGLWVRDAEHSYLALDESDEDPMNQLQGHSITYRIAVGPHQGRKVFTTCAARCRPCPTQKSHSLRTEWLVSRCTPAWRSKRASGRSSNGSAAT